MISDRALAELWAAFHAKRRANSTTIKVEASSLGALLEAHHALYSQLSTQGKLTVVLADDHVSMVGGLTPKDFEAFAKAVEQRRAFAKRASE